MAVRVLRQKNDALYLPLDVLGRGAHGVVTKVIRNNDGKVMACKAIDFSRNLSMLSIIKREMGTWVAVSKEPGIASLSECVIVQPTFNVLFYMDYYEGGDLQRFIDSCHSLGNPVHPILVCFIAREVSRGLANCHKYNILHRDLKPLNVLLGITINCNNALWKLTQNNEALTPTEAADISSFLEEMSKHRDKWCCISDFGLSKKVGTQNWGSIGVVMGTPGYIAPESLRVAHYSGKSDVYSLGALMYALCEGNSPKQGQKAVSMAYSTELRALIHSCLSSTPFSRPSAKDVFDRICSLHEIKMVEEIIRTPLIAAVPQHKPAPRREQEPLPPARKQEVPQAPKPSPNHAQIPIRPIPIPARPVPQPPLFAPYPARNPMFAPAPVLVYAPPLIPVYAQIPMYQAHQTPPPRPRRRYQDPRPHSFAPVLVSPFGPENRRMDPYY